MSVLIVSSTSEQTVKVKVRAIHQSHVNHTVHSIICGMCRGQRGPSVQYSLTGGCMVGGPGGTWLNSQHSGLHTCRGGRRKYHELLPVSTDIHYNKVY